MERAHRQDRGQGGLQGGGRVTLLDAALDYASRGWRVLLLKPGGKEPLLKRGRGHLGATTDPAKIRAWWSKYPDANVGVLCGPESFEVLDVDGEAGARSLAALEALYGPLPETREHRTPHGRHLCFLPGGLSCSTHGLGPGLDTKGSGDGYVATPPSVVNGIQYVVSKNVAVAPLPAWLLVELANAKKKTSRTLDESVVDTPEGERNKTAHLKGFVAGLNITPATVAEVEQVIVAKIHTSPSFPEKEARRAVRNGLAAGLAAVAHRYRNVPYAPEDDPRFRSLSADAGHIWLRLLTWRASIIVPGVSVGGDEAALAGISRLPERRVRAALGELRRQGFLRADRRRRLFWLPGVHLAAPPSNWNVAVQWLKAIHREIPPCSLRDKLLDSLQRTRLGRVFVMRVTFDARGRMQALPPLHEGSWKQEQIPSYTSSEPPEPLETAAATASKGEPGP